MQHARQSNDRSTADLSRATAAFPLALEIQLAARWPAVLPEETTSQVLAAPLPGRRDAAGRAIMRGSGLVSIVVVTFNNLVFTRMCLESVLAHTADRDYEIVVVDNGSTDGTPDYLRALARRQRRLRVRFNTGNLGFAPANNQGLEQSRGEYLVLLNNDTIVPPGWLGRLIAHLDEPTVGMVGPVTNRAGNEAQIEVPYRTFGELIQFADDYTRGCAGASSEIPMLTMFCVAMRRDLYQRVGPLDERFEVGMFEDDDYALRVRAAGYRVVCAEDVFVHHFGQASIGKLASTGVYGTLFEANRRRFEQKWQTRWQPHSRSPDPRYAELVPRICAAARSSLPPNATVIVISKGDDALLSLDGRPAWHFPRMADGTYAGYYPADSTRAIAQLEKLRAQGGGYLLIPATALWWLEHYPEFDAHLRRYYRPVVWRPDTCLIFSLQRRETDDGACYRPHTKGDA